MLDQEGGDRSPPGSSFSTAGVNLGKPPSRFRNLMIKYVPVHRYRNLDFLQNFLAKSILHSLGAVWTQNILPVSGSETYGHSFKCRFWCSSQDNQKV